MKQRFMNSTKKKGYLQGKLLRPVYEERLKQEQKQKNDTVQFCNRFAEEVAKEAIKSQIISVELEVQKLEWEIQEKKNAIGQLKEKRDSRAQEIWIKYDEKVTQLKERKHIFLTMDNTPLENLVEISRTLDARVDGVVLLAKAAESEYENSLSQSLNQLRDAVEKNQDGEYVREQYDWIKSSVDQQIKLDFAFPEIREAFKQIGLFFLFLITLFFDFLLAYTVMADFFKVGTSRALDISLPFWIWVVSAQIGASILTIMVTLILMLFFRFFKFRKEQIWDRQKYSVQTLVSYWFVFVFLGLWIYQSTSDWEDITRNVEFIFRILFIPALLIGEVILNKLDWNVVFDMLKKICVVPVKLLEYAGYFIGRIKLSKSYSKAGEIMLNEVKDITDQQFKSSKQVQDNILTHLTSSVKELKEISSFIYSSYETQIITFQEQLEKIEQDRLEAIKKWTEEYTQEIKKIEDMDIPKLDEQVKIYRKKINERIQEASQWVLEWLIDE